jgi:molybdopterin-binding protein
MIIDIDRPLGDGRRLRVDLEVEDGENLVVFGPNGAGKSTLLRLLAGTLPGGQPIDASYLPQRAVALRGSGRRNLLLGLGKVEAAKALELAAAMGIDGALSRPARSLSGGERQRLAISRALATDAATVLLDEPMAPIDAADRQRVIAVVKEQLARRTAVIVTHEHRTAAALGDRVAVLVDGGVHQVAPPSVAFALPGSEAAAAAIGISNVIDGEVMEVGDGLVALEAGPLVVWGMGTDPAVGRAVFGAEAVTVFAGDHPDAGSARNTWAGTVTEIRQVGTLVELVVDCGPTIVAMVTPGALTGLGTGPGDPVTLAVKATGVAIL